MRRSLLRLGIGAMLYGALALSANAVAAGLTAEQKAEIETLRVGQMQKLVLLKQSRPSSEAEFVDGDGNQMSLKAFRGKVVMLNFWATWCPPCLAEMPSIDRLAGEVAGDDIAVVTLSMDRGSVSRIRDFFEKETPVKPKIVNLEIYHDKRNVVAAETGILGLPVTLILDRDGHEIARLQGDAEWDSEEAKAVLRRLAEMTEPAS